jgi:hypothetical protein
MKKNNIDKIIKKYNESLINKNITPRFILVTPEKKAEIIKELKDYSYNICNAPNNIVEISIMGMPIVTIDEVIHI